MRHSLPALLSPPRKVRRRHRVDLRLVLLDRDVLGLRSFGALRVRGGLPALRFNPTGKRFHRLDFGFSLEQECSLLAPLSFQLCLDLIELHESFSGEVLPVDEHRAGKYEQGYAQTQSSE